MINYQQLKVSQYKIGLNKKVNNIPELLPANFSSRRLKRHIVLHKIFNLG